MTSAESIFAFSVVAAVCLQAFLTVRVWRAQSYDREQKVAQTKLIWMLPVLGAVLVFSLMPDESQTNGRPKSHIKS